MKAKPKKAQTVQKTPSARLWIQEHTLVSLIMGGLLVAAVITRAHLLDRSLWLDEAWLANAIQAGSLHDAIYYDDWLQTTPPLFVVLARWVTQIFGVSNAALRGLPAFFGVLSVLVLAFVALKLLKPSFAMIALLLFVCSPRLILYSQSLKQYSTDVFATVTLLALGIVYIQKGSDRFFYLFMVAVAVLSFFSYPATLFLTFLLYSAIFEPEDQSRPNRVKVSKALLVLALGILVLGANYFFFIAPNKNASLAEFFPEGFNPGARLVDLIRFYTSRLSTVTGVFFFGGAGFLGPAALLVSIVGFVSLWVPGRAGTLHQAVLFSAPVAGIVALNFAGLYPIPSFNHRLLLFIFPITCLIFCFGLQILANLASRLVVLWAKKFPLDTLVNALGSLVFIVLTGLTIMYFHLVGLEPFFAQEQEKAQEAVRYLAQQVKAQDILYVHASMREQFKLYSRGNAFLTTNIVYGTVGFPCCPRKYYRSPQQETLSDVAGEIVTLSNAAAGQSLWLLITDRSYHWRHLQRNDIQTFEHGLARSGCGKTGGTNFTGVHISRFVCQPK